MDIDLTTTTCLLYATQQTSYISLAPIDSTDAMRISNNAEYVDVRATLPSALGGENTSHDGIMNGGGEEF